MEIAINNEAREVEILAVNLAGQSIDFRWINGNYNGVCTVPANIELTPTQLSAIAGAIQSGAGG